jgi:hypothetical protein
VTLPLILIVTGIAVTAIWGFLLPGLDRVFPSQPKWLASDPAALARFRRTSRRQGIVAGVFLAVSGAVLLVLTTLG